MPLPDPGCQLGDSDELDAYVAMLDFCTEQLGPLHPRTLAAARSLAVAFWSAGYTDQAISLLDQALDRFTSTLGREHPMRVDFLCTLSEILFEQRQLERAETIQREVLDCRVERCGANHPDSFEAKSDLAAVLFELGRNEEASRFEQEAFEGAQAHLGRSHPVACVLAWNRAMSYARSGDADSARRIIVSDLVWLLAAEPSSLEPDQNTIREMVGRHVNWEEATAC